MPVSVQIGRLELELERRGTQGVTVLNTDLYSLEGAERHLALDAVVAGEPSPLVFLDGRLVCNGFVDVDVVMGALAGAPLK
jgi:hypothetical protein